MLLLLKGWMADLLFLLKLSRDCDSGGYGVTLLGTKTSSCEGLRIFEENLVISFLCSSTSLFLLNYFLYFSIHDSKGMIVLSIRDEGK